MAASKPGGGVQWRNFAEARGHQQTLKDHVGTAMDSDGQRRTAVCKKELQGKGRASCSRSPSVTSPQVLPKTAVEEMLVRTFQSFFVVEVSGGHGSPGVETKAEPKIPVSPLGHILTRSRKWMAPG